jgi:hypothetical protein
MRPVVLALAALAAPAQAAPAEPVPCGACLVLQVSAAEATVIARGGSEPLDRLRILVVANAAAAGSVTDAVAALAERGARPGLVVEVDAGGGHDPNALTDQARRLAAEGVLLDASRHAPAAALAYGLKTSATALRAAGWSRLGLRLTAAAAPGALAQGLAPYFDYFVIPGPLTPDLAASVGPAERWTAERANGGLDLAAAMLLPAQHAAAHALVELPPGLVPLAPLVAALADAVPAGLAALPEVSVRCDRPCRARGYLDAETLDAVVLVRPEDGVVTRATAQPAAERMSAIVPALALSVPQPGGRPPWRMDAAGATLALPPTSRPFVVRIRGWQGRVEEAFSTGVEVRGARTLTAEEILARHQAARARQETIVRSLVSSGSTVLTFEAPGFSAPVTVTAATTIYTSGGLTEVEQRDIRVNGLSLATRGDEVPKLPLIEPERVATPPLTITLDEQYRYRLEGLEPLDGRATYLVSFEPRSEERSLFAGRAWIDAETFGLARIDATQTALPGPVVTSRQVDAFQMTRVGDEVLWLPARSEIHQRYETASAAIPIHRVVVLSERRVNDPAFDERLEAAHRSNAVMLRDTPEGYRYLQRPRGAATVGEPRVVARDRAQRVRTLAGGVTWDPNITVPLVFAGLSYLDFDLFGTGAQIDGFFGGTYGRLAWSGPPMGRGGWRAAGDAFGIAFPYNERLFRDGVEQYGENVTQRPLHVSAGWWGRLPAPGGCGRRTRWTTWPTGEPTRRSRSSSFPRAPRFTASGWRSSGSEGRGWRRRGGTSPGGNDGARGGSPAGRNGSCARSSGSACARPVPSSGRRGRWAGWRPRGWTGGASIGSAATPSAPSTTRCAATRARACATTAGWRSARPRRGPCRPGSGSTCSPTSAWCATPGGRRGRAATPGSGRARSSRSRSRAC